MASDKNTDSKVAALKARADQYELPDFGQGSVVGLAVRVSPRGKKTWTYRYRDAAGKQKRVSLGTYPNTGLAGARRRAGEMNTLRESGEDPASHIAEKKVEAQRDAAATLSGLFGTYAKLAAVGLHRPNGKPKRQRTLDEESYYWDRFINPEFGARSVKSITSRDVRGFIARLQSEGHVSSARHCHALLRLLFGMARRSEDIDVNPMDIVDAPPKPENRDRVLTDQEIKLVWRALVALAEGRPDDVPRLREPEGEDKPLHLSRSMALCLQLAFVTAQRDGEIAGLDGGELALTGDHPAWTIPGERTKNRKTHVVPLSPLALSIIENAYSQARLMANPANPANLVENQKAKKATSGLILANGAANGHSGPAFPSPRDPSKPITRHAVSRAMARLREHMGIEDVTPHDFRRTAATHMTGERIGKPRFIVSRVLNHSSDTGGAAKVTDVYDRNAYLAEKRAALNAWAEELLRLTMS